MAEAEEKTEGRKSRWSFPLNRDEIKVSIVDKVGAGITVGLTVQILQDGMYFRSPLLKHFFIRP